MQQLVFFPKEAKIQHLFSEEAYSFSPKTIQLINEI